MWLPYLLVFLIGTSYASNVDDLEKYILELNQEQNATVKPDKKDNISWIEDILVKDNLSNKADTEADCQSAEGPGLCVKKSECDLDTPKVDPATLFILREGTIGGNNTIANTVKEDCPWLKICCSKNKLLSQPKVVKYQQPLGCGYSNPGANVFRETTGDYAYADFGDFPWMVALMTNKNSENKKFAEQYIGGGSIIHPSVVITVAHKVYNMTKPYNLKCRAGEWDSTTDAEVYAHQDRNVKDIVVHKRFFSLHVHNNVALLILKTPFILEDSPHIGVACLEPTLPPSGTSCFSMGWGQDFVKQEKNKFADVLKKIKLNLVDGNKCQNQYRNSKLGRGYTLDASLTCAGGKPDVDTCIGDGGAPLVCPIESKDRVRYSVVGMVAYGLDCGTGNLPGVYVKVPHIYDWVIDEMTAQGFNISGFVY